MTAAVEILLSNSKSEEDLENDRKSSFLRLCMSMQAVLKTQVDRCFVFGLLICEKVFRVFCCDRAGMLGTSSWIDIHSVLEYMLSIFVRDFFLCDL